MISVDISNVWGAISLPELLMTEQEVFAAHMTLTDGSGEGSDYLGWMDLPTSRASWEIQRIQSAAKTIRETSDVFIVIGIGGSYLGPRAAIELLQGPNRNLGKGKGDPMILYMGNSLSTRQWNETKKLLEGRDFSLCVISKSGTTTEPAIAFRNLKWLLERKYGTDAAKKRIWAITDKTRGALRQMAALEGWESFQIPSDVGGRFSVLSPVGLLPMAVAGIDIMEVLSGALEGKENTDLRSFENPVWLYAGVRNALYRKGKSVEVLESFEPGFAMMGRWWQQLFGESEGKDGKGLFPVPAELTADLHSLGQFIQDGPGILFETMIRFDPPQDGLTIGQDPRNLDGLNYLAGRELSFVEDMACMGTVMAHTDGGVPVLTIECGELNERTLGELFWFFELSCAISAYMLGVNPFNQPGVEGYKRNMFRLLGKPGCE